MAGSDSIDWQQLEAQTRTLVADGQGYQRVQRDLNQLQRLADLQRARTTRLRTSDNTLAATRLLVAQGLDSQQLLAEGQALQLAPMTDGPDQAPQPADVAEFLDKVQRDALQAVMRQQEEAASAEFERFMDAALEREWAADKHQMFSQIAPFTGGGGAGGLGPRGAAGPTVGSISDREQAYAQVVRRLNQAAGAGQLQSVNAAKEFAEVCAKFEGARASLPGGMVSCWQLVGSLLEEVAASEAGAGQRDTLRLLGACLNGARKHLERGHEKFMRQTVAANREVAQRGGGLEQVREVRAFLAAKLQGRGVLDFQQPGGQDTTWIQVFYCLRNGWHDAARSAAAAAPESLMRATDVTLARCLAEWLDHRSLSDRSQATLARDCELLLRERAAVRQQFRFPYMVLLCCLMTGDMRPVDALQREVAGLFGNIEDYMWYRLAVARPQGQVGAASSSVAPAAPAYTVGDLQAEINRCNASYYSKGGREPLLYVTVLLLTFQFNKALDFLWKDEGCQKHRTDAVHLAVTLHLAGVLGLAPSEGAVTAATVIEQYGRRFLKVEGEAALHYFMMAAAAAGNDMQLKGRLLREVLTEAPSFGTLLGSGGAMGAGGLLAVFEPDAGERRRLLEAVAHDCMRAAQAEHAIELFMAAGCTEHALGAINATISLKLHDSVRSTAASPSNEVVQRLMKRGNDAATQLASSNNAVARQEVWAFGQLKIVQQALAAGLAGRHQEAVQALQQLSFLPIDQRSVPAASSKVSELPQPLTRLLPEVLQCAAVSLQALVSPPTVGGPLGVAPLKEQLRALQSYANSIPYSLPRSVIEHMVQASAAIMM